ncbi:MAG: 3-deoxy-manno-octulosonate cytidylyltransferase [Cyanobacteria bacterium SID2]|nr:3-deoxy-manno-octulosonate cytidylyltransferase [Cyanobacteria bacterium SID2]
MTKITGIIPARYKSVRFEGKPLAKIGDKTMIQMVYERCLQSELLDRVRVATDDRRIYDSVLSFGGQAVMTGEDIATGSDRCCAAVKGEDWDIVVNIQGDEPLIDPQVIDTCVRSLLDAPEAVCSTPVVATTDLDEINSPHAVKVALNQKIEALYFSRYPIPYNRKGIEGKTYYKHIGLYCYRKPFLEKYVTMPQTPLETSESLEQLRMLENGYKIQCCLVKYESVGVDTKEDLEKVKTLLGV